jgi:hypothetical protein
MGSRKPKAVDFSMQYAQTGLQSSSKMKKEKKTSGFSLKVICDNAYLATLPKFVV